MYRTPVIAIATALVAGTGFAFAGHAALALIFYTEAAVIVASIVREVS